MTHRKYSRTRNAIHKAMARSPGARMPKWMRIAQSLEDQGNANKELSVMKSGWEKPEIEMKSTPNGMQEHRQFQKKFKDRMGFVNRLFNRKTGGQSDIRFMVVMIFCASVTILFLSILR